MLNPKLTNMLSTMNAPVYFITGIDTDIGKTYATGYLAKCLQALNRRVITQKLVQTGGSGLSADIAVHRQIMAMPLQAVDDAGLTMPVRLSYPASPHLAAKIDNVEIDLQYIAHCTQALSEQYELVLIEGAGGICVPLLDNVLIVDYIKRHNYPVLLVTSGRLGSINHTLLSLKILSAYHLSVFAVIYNTHQHADDEIICQDTHDFFANYLEHHHPTTTLIALPVIGD